MKRILWTSGSSSYLIIESCNHFSNESILFCFVPINRSPQSFFKRSLRAEAEFFKCACDIQLAAWLPVRFIGLPSDLALEFCQTRNRLDKVSNQNLSPVAQIHGRALVVI